MMLTVKLLLGVTLLIVQCSTQEILAECPFFDTTENEEIKSGQQCMLPNGERGFCEQPRSLCYGKEIENPPVMNEKGEEIFDPFRCGAGTGFRVYKGQLECKSFSRFVGCEQVGQKCTDYTELPGVCKNVPNEKGDVELTCVLDDAACTTYSGTCARHGERGHCDVNHAFIALACQDEPNKAECFKQKSMSDLLTCRVGSVNTHCYGFGKDGEAQQSPCSLHHSLGTCTMKCDLGSGYTTCPGVASDGTIDREAVCEAAVRTGRQESIAQCLGEAAECKSVDANCILHNARIYPNHQCEVPDLLCATEGRLCIEHNQIGVCDKSLNCRDPSDACPPEQSCDYAAWQKEQEKLENNDGNVGGGVLIDKDDFDDSTPCTRKQQLECEALTQCDFFRELRCDCSSSPVKSRCGDRYQNETPEERYARTEAKCSANFRCRPIHQECSALSKEGDQCYNYGTKGVCKADKDRDRGFRCVEADKTCGKAGDLCTVDERSAFCGFPDHVVEEHCPGVSLNAAVPDQNFFRYCPNVLSCQREATACLEKEGVKEISCNCLVQFNRCMSDCPAVEDWLAPICHQTCGVGHSECPDYDPSTMTRDECKQKLEKEVTAPPICLATSRCTDVGGACLLKGEDGVCGDSCVYLGEENTAAVGVDCVPKLISVPDAAKWCEKLPASARARCLNVETACGGEPANPTDKDRDCLDTKLTDCAKTFANCAQNGGDPQNGGDSCKCMQEFISCTRGLQCSSFANLGKSCQSSCGDDSEGCFIPTPPELGANGELLLHSACINAYMNVHQNFACERKDVPCVAEGDHCVEHGNTGKCVTESGKLMCEEASDFCPAGTSCELPAVGGRTRKGLCNSAFNCQAQDKPCGNDDDAEKCEIRGYSGTCISSSSAQAAALATCLAEEKESDCYTRFATCFTGCAVPAQGCGPDKMCSFGNNSDELSCVEGDGRKLVRVQGLIALAEIQLESNTPVSRVQAVLDSEKIESFAFLGTSTKASDEGNIFLLLEQDMLLNRAQYISTLAAAEKIRATNGISKVTVLFGGESATACEAIQCEGDFECQFGQCVMLLDNGVCKIDDSNDVTCTCEAGWTGDACDEKKTGDEPIDTDEQTELAQFVYKDADEDKVKSKIEEILAALAPKVPVEVYANTGEASGLTTVKVIADKPEEDLASDDLKALRAAFESVVDDDGLESHTFLLNQLEPEPIDEPLATPAPPAQTDSSAASALALCSASVLLLGVALA